MDGRRARIVDVPAHTRAHVRRLFRDDVRCDAARVLGLRRPRIAFGACGRDGALVAGTSVHGSSLVSWAAVVDVRFASPPTRGSWDCGHRVGIDEDVRALASSSADL